MDFSFTPDQAALIDRAAALAAKSLAPRAAAHDEARTYPQESWHDLWRELFTFDSDTSGPRAPARCGPGYKDKPAWRAKRPRAASRRQCAQRGAEA